MEIGNKNTDANINDNGILEMESEYYIVVDEIKEQLSYGVILVARLR